MRDMRILASLTAGLLLAATITLEKTPAAGKRPKLAELKLTHEQLSGQLVETRAEKEKVEAELKRVQNELTAKLEPEIQAGNVHVFNATSGQRI